MIKPGWKAMEKHVNVKPILCTGLKITVKFIEKKINGSLKVKKLDKINKK
jgi:hypothetical protein